MKDNELDDLFRSNADYLADEPPRGFDKDAFWQQLQTELPKKTDRRKKMAAWWWAAASVLLIGLFSGIWFMQSGDLGVKRQVAGKVEVKTVPKRIAQDSVPETAIAIIHKENSISPIPEGQNLSKNPLAKKEKSPPHSPFPIPEEIAVEPLEMTTTDNPPLVENGPDLPEVVVPAIPEKPVYRVVHINEIRQRKQQEAKTQSRVAFRIGLPSSLQVSTPSDSKPLLTIPIQH